jgi:hypothetical protein
MTRNEAENCLCRSFQVSDERLDVLDCADEIFLKGGFPQSSPSCPVEAVSGASSIGPFHRGFS